MKFLLPSEVSETKKDFFVSERSKVTNGQYRVACHVRDWAQGLPLGKYHLFINTAHAGAISNATPITTILENILQFLLSIVGVLAIISLVVAGVMYLTAAGNTKQVDLAKKAVQFSIIGIVVALGALLIVSQLGSFFAP